MKELWRMDRNNLLAMLSLLLPPTSTHPIQDTSCLSENIMSVLAHTWSRTSSVFSSFRLCWAYINCRTLGLQRDP